MFSFFRKEKPSPVKDPTEVVDLGIAGQTEFGTQVANAMSLAPGEWHFSPDCSTAYHRTYGSLTYKNGRLYHLPYERTSFQHQARVDVGHDQRYLTAEDVAPIMEAWRAALTRAIEKKEAPAVTQAAGSMAVAAGGLTATAAQMQLQQQLAAYQQQQQQLLNTSTPSSHFANAPRYMFAGTPYASGAEAIAAAKQAGLSDEDIQSLLKFNKV